MTPEEKRELDLLYISPYKWKGSEAWLVKFKHYPSGRTPKHTSKQFRFNAYESADAALDAAREYRDKWIDEHQDELWLRGRTKFSQRLPVNNTSGILGVNRITRMLPSGTLGAQWQTSFRLPNGKKRGRKFSVHRLGELGALKAAIQCRKEALEALLTTDKYRADDGILELTSYYSDILDNLFELNDSNEPPGILEIVRNEKVPATTRFQQILARIGQQTFRQEVLDHFDHKCGVTGSAILIRASHIKPWRVASDEERLDPMNGLALSPTYDAAFDQGLISFRSDGKILVASELAADAQLLGITGDERIQALAGQHATYLDWHRKNIFSPLNKRGEQDAADQLPALGELKSE